MITADESTLMCIYGGMSSSKQDLINEISKMQQDLTKSEKKLKKLSDKVINILNNMSEEDFIKLQDDLVPDLF